MHFKKKRTETKHTSGHIIGPRFQAPWHKGQKHSPPSRETVPSGRVRYPLEKKDKGIFGEEVEGLGDYFAYEPHMGGGFQELGVGSG